MKLLSSSNLARQRNGGNWMQGFRMQETEASVDIAVSLFSYNLRVTGRMTDNENGNGSGELREAYQNKFT
jgi:hypothetical protein